MCVRAGCILSILHVCVSSSQILLLTFLTFGSVPVFGVCCVLLAQMLGAVREEESTRMHPFSVAGFVVGIVVLDGWEEVLDTAWSLCR